MTMPFYQEQIRLELARLGLLGIEARHVEAFMRLEHGTLDQLSKSQFVREVRDSARACLALGNAKSEELARSFGL